MKTAMTFLGILVLRSLTGFAQPSPIVIENAHLRYTISSQGSNLAFIDRSTGVDYLNRATTSVCALLRCHGVEYEATSAALANGRLTLEFGEAHATAVLRVESLGVWYNNLPKGKTVKCTIGPIKALPMVDCAVKNPSITVNGKTLVLPVEMTSGSHLEFSGDKGSLLYGSKG